MMDNVMLYAGLLFLCYMLGYDNGKRFAYKHMCPYAKKEEEV